MKQYEQHTAILTFLGGMMQYEQHTAIPNFFVLRCNMNNIHLFQAF